MLTRRQVLKGLGAIAAVSLVGCGRPEEASACRPLPIIAGDECAVCGMYITEYPGPKGQVCLTGHRGTLKFCSTRDLFAWLLQPESRAVTNAVYVHDMARTDWQHPDDEALIDARSAWFVIDHPLPGAMGPTLAAFAERADAGAFAQEYQGRVLAYGDVTLEVLESMSGGMGHHGPHGHGGHAPAHEEAPVRGHGHHGHHGHR